MKETFKSIKLYTIEETRQKWPMLNVTKGFYQENYVVDVDILFINLHKFLKMLIYQCLWIHSTLGANYAQFMF